MTEANKNTLNFNFEHAYTNFEFCFSAEVPAQGITAIWGQSGCGKSTLLRCIAGLEPQVKGKLSINQHCMQDKQSFVPAHKRNIGYVFQQGALFAHLNVEENLTYGLNNYLANNKANSQELTFTLESLVELMGLHALLKRSVDKLSGGERQRVAIARALLSQPKLLLMDEPLAALDQQNKQALLKLLEQIKQQLQIPILYVSHDINEVCRLADHLLVIQDGKIVESGDLNSVLARLGQYQWMQEQVGVVLQGQVVAHIADWQLDKINSHGTELLLANTGAEIGDNIRIRILAKDVSISREQQAQSSIVNRIACRIKAFEVTASSTNMQLQLVIEGNQTISDDAYLMATITRYSLEQLNLQINDLVYAQIKAVSIVS